MPPLSNIPEKPTNWWKTIPGQLATLAIAIGLIVILLGVTGVIGPHS